MPLSSLKYIEIGQALAKKLVLANKKLKMQNNELSLNSSELEKVNMDLLQKQNDQKEYIEGLEVIIFMTSHRVRQPIAHILGLTHLLTHKKNSDEEISTILNYLNVASHALDTFTKELTLYATDLSKKSNSQKISP